MLIKSTYLKVIITALALSSSISTFASEVKFKLAIIKDSSGIQDKNIIAFNKKMNLCAAFTRSKDTIEAESACSDAITSFKTIKGNTNKTKYYESLSYSNRGISRFLNDDISGAKDDFIAAIVIDSNTITKGNLKLLKQHSLVDESISSSVLSD